MELKWWTLEHFEIKLRYFPFGKVGWGFKNMNNLGQALAKSRRIDFSFEFVKLGKNFLLICFRFLKHFLKRNLNYEKM